MRLNLTEKIKEKWLNTPSRPEIDIMDQEALGTLILAIDCTNTYDEMIEFVQTCLIEKPTKVFMIPFACTILFTLEHHLNKVNQALMIQDIFELFANQNLNIKDFGITAEELNDAIKKKLLEVIKPSVDTLIRSTKFSEQESAIVDELSLGLDYKYYTLQDIRMTSMQFRRFRLHQSRWLRT